jgi:hypothetical protein
VTVRTPDAERFLEVLKQADGKIIRHEGDELSVEGLTPPRIAELASANKVALHGLSEQRETLEEVFLRTTYREEQ